MRKLVRKVIVSDVKPIVNADAIELALIGGWQCVVKKDSFVPGQEAVYFEIDSCLPADDDRYSFLKERCLKEWRDGDKVIDSCIRIKTVKLRGEISQGLLLPVSEFPEITSIPVGEDCSEVLKVRLFEELDLMYNKKFKSGSQKGVFPSFIPRTDEERIQNLSDYWEKYKDTAFEVTRKVDGSSMTIFYAPSKRESDPYGVCSRNFELKLEDTSSSYVAASIDMHLKDKLETIYNETGAELAVQGELNGIGMNANRDKLKDLRFNVFKIWDITNQNYLDCDERRAICKRFGFSHVPVLKTNFKAFQELPTMAEMLEFAEGKTENGNEREGVVFKEEGTKTPVSFKVISNKYLLKEN